MYKSILFIAFLFLTSCKATTYYIVRHAEKETSTTMSGTNLSGDVPLSAAGKQRAEALKVLLQKENIRHIFSTNYIRTKSTAQPLADAIHVPVEIYNPRDSTFPTKLRSLNGNILIVGHSNTVDDLVNALSGKQEIAGDLPESDYGDLFIVKKKGKKISFERKHFGQ